MSDYIITNSITVDEDHSFSVKVPTARVTIIVDDTRHDTEVPVGNIRHSKTLHRVEMGEENWPDELEGIDPQKIVDADVVVTDDETISGTITRATSLDFSFVQD